MVAHLLRLRLDSLIGALRGDLRQRVRVSAALAATAALVAALVWASVRLRDAREDLAADWIVIGGAVCAAAFFVAPLTRAGDDPLDPRRFTLLGLRPGPLTGGLALAGLLSVPVLALAVGCAAVWSLWVAHGVSRGAATASAVLAAVTVLLLARCASAAAALSGRRERSRRIIGIPAIVSLAALALVLAAITATAGTLSAPDPLSDTARVLALSPLGAVWALPLAPTGADATAGVVVAVATVAVLAALWVWLTRLLLTRPERASTAREQRGLGWFSLLPGTPAGAIAARSLVYWSRDPRYLVNAIVIPIASVATAVPLLLVGVPLSTAALLPVPLMALLYGWLPHNDLAYDGTALWMHLAADTGGAADRIGRLIPVLLTAVPLLVIATPVATALHGSWSTLPALAGVVVGLFLTGLGLSSISSALSPYAVARPGDSPFEQPQRTGGGLAQGMVLAGSLALTAPALWQGWLTLTDGVEHALPALWAGCAVGLGTLVAGVALGGWIFTRRSSRLMEFAETT